MNKLIEFINDLATDLFYEKTLLFGKDLFQRGACYELFLIIQSIEKDIKLYIHKKHNHVTFEYKGELYDSTGQIQNKDDYRLPTNDDINFINEYFGEAYKFLKIKETMIKELEIINIKEIRKKFSNQKQKVLT